MGIVWGLIIAVIGAVFIVWGRGRSEFVVYRILVARARILWGERVHGFFWVAGAMMIVVGAVLAITG